MLASGGLLLLRRPHCRTARQRDERKTATDDV